MRGVLGGAADVFATARAERRSALTESEALELVRGLGIGVPEHAPVRGAAAAHSLDLRMFPGDRVVVKVVSPEILHKTDAGGVAVVAKDREAIAAAIDAMAGRLAGRTVAGWAIYAFVEHEASFGGELLLGMRWTEDFGPIVTLGPGGIHAEHLARELRPGREVTLVSPDVPLGDADADLLDGSALGPALTRPFRGKPPRMDARTVREIVERCLEFAARHMPHDLTDLEINPLVVTPGGPVALDALAKLGSGARAELPRRPLHKMRHLLEPRSIAVVGVSERMNPGHIILNNVLRQGFDRSRVFVVKPKAESIEGCRCVPGVSALPEPVDLLVLSVDAAQVPALLEEVLATRMAETAIVIPGGLGERAGTEETARRVERLLAESRNDPWEGPLINGGNCLGIRSRPGRYDTLFIPEHKMGVAGGTPSPLAILSQSGAFAVARANRLARLNPRYLVSFGNQMDVTIGDYLEYFQDDPEVEVVACYLEGFRPLDGGKWLRAASRITAAGRSVILYRGGRTAAGAGAAASHTASIAGEYTVTRELCRRAGVVVADTLADFDDLVRLFTWLRDKRVRGPRLGAVSNAGFECVAMADSLAGFRLADLAPETRKRLEELLRRHRLDGIVSVQNPLDLTPILDDAGYEEACRAVLDDPGVDVGILGCVPMTGALNTLPRGEGHGEDVSDPGSVALRLARLALESDKPAALVVDGGSQYDPMAAHIEEQGVPVFRSADRALRLLDVFCRSRRRTTSLGPGVSGAGSMR